MAAELGQGRGGGSRSGSTAAGGSAGSPRSALPTTFLQNSKIGFSLPSCALRAFPTLFPWLGEPVSILTPLSGVLIAY